MEVGEDLKMNLGWQAGQGHVCFSAGWVQYMSIFIYIKTQLTHFVALFVRKSWDLTVIAWISQCGGKLGCEGSREIGVEI